MARDALAFLPLQLMESAGWIDVGKLVSLELASTVPTVGFSEREFATFRADYFFATERLDWNSENYAVVRNALTDHASDHYPIWAEFQATVRNKDVCWTGPSQGPSLIASFMASLSI